MFSRLALVAWLLATGLVSESGLAQEADTEARVTADPIVILISIDGFRCDYFERYRPPHLMELAASGVRAKRMIPCFPSKTFPNHYSIATGLLPVHHGIIGNDMFDPVWHAEFHIGSDPSARDGRWWGGEPIWNTVERQGLIAACCFWPGSDAPIGGKRPTIWLPYQHHKPIDERVALVLSWLDLPSGHRPSFITLYFHQVDSTGHDFGPLAPQTRDAVLMIDEAIGKLMAGVASRGLQSSVNFVVVSDHGMTDVSTKRIVYIDDFIEPATVHIDFQGVIAGLRPGDSTTTPEQLRDRFRDKNPHVHAYLSADLPERLHFTGNRRIPPVVLLADPGWEVATRAKAATWNPDTMHGAHGYDPELPEMGALFIAQGPAFRRGVTLPRASNLDVYDLICAILGVEPAPNDGSRRLATAALKSP